MKSISQLAFRPVALASSTLLSAALLSAGSIAGKVEFKGDKPKPAVIKMTADKTCQKMHTGDVLSDQVVVNGNGTLKNVFVYVKSGLPKKTWPTPKEKVKFDQSGCQYTPHVLGIMVNQTLEVVNSDATLHNVHALAKKSKEFNIAQPKKGMKTPKTFTAPEVMVKIKCDVHSWMAAYLGVLDHPFYGVTDANGAFTIDGLPAGEYELEAWHEKYGTKTMKVKVGDADKAAADFSFSAK